MKTLTSECMLGTERGNTLSRAGSCTQGWVRTRVLGELVTRVLDIPETRDLSLLAADILPCCNSTQGWDCPTESRRQISETDKRWFIDSWRCLVVHCCCYRVVHHGCGVVGGELQTGALTGQSSHAAGGRGVSCSWIYWGNDICDLSAPSSSPLGARQTLHGVRTLDTQVMIVM